MDIAWQSSLDLLHVFKNARPRPVEIGPILEDDEDIGISEHCLGADRFDVGRSEKLCHDGIGDLVFDEAWRLAGPRRVNDDLHIGDVRQRIQGNPAQRPDSC